MAKIRKKFKLAKDSQTLLGHLPFPTFSLFCAISLFISIALLTSCSFPVRTGYDRKIGGYKPAATSQESQQAEQTSAQASTTQSKAAQARTPQAQPKRTTASNTKAAAANKIANPPPPRSKGSLEKYASEWLGAKYVYGAASKSKTDCSGFVMQVFKGYYNLALDHNAGKMYKDSRGSSVSRGSLKEGDLVFFGSFWKIDHVGIYLSGERFIHASTSKGVMISPMNDKYWSPKYQGARRFK